MSSKVVSKKSSSKPVAPVVVATPVAAPVEKKAAPSRSVSPAPVVAPVVAEAEAERTLTDELKSLQDQLTAIRDAANAALLSLKRVAKRATLDVKDAKKKRRAPKEDEGGERKLSNFEIPVAISDELSAFFGGHKGATMSRAEVNKRMFTYAKEHFLSQGQTIHLEPTASALDKISADTVKAGGKALTAAERDAAAKRQAAGGKALRALLVIPAGENLTIFNIQKYMGRHYPKAAVA
jgi:hypothetical protein